MDSIYSTFLIKTHIFLFCLSLATIIMGAILTWVHPAGIAATSPAGDVLWSRHDSDLSGPDLPVESFSALTPLLGIEVEFIQTASIPIFIIGWLLLLTISLGFYSLAWRMTPILYAVFIILLIFNIWCISALAMVGQYERNVAWKMSSEFEKYIYITYTGKITGKKSTSIIDYVQARLKCCGAEDGSLYLDPGRAPELYPEVKRQKWSIIPVSCCTVHKGNFTPVDPHCPKYANSTNSNVKIGCHKQVHSIYNAYSLAIRKGYTWMICQLCFIIVIYFYLGYFTYKMILL